MFIKKKVKKKTFDFKSMFSLEFSKQLNLYLLKEIQKSS